VTLSPRAQDRALAGAVLTASVVEGATLKSLDGPRGAVIAIVAAMSLLERTREAGLPVTLHVEGVRRPLPAGAELAIYRVVQEALTNAIKQAGGATTRVDLRWGDDALALRVADRGDGGASPELVGAGHGLIGMSERLRVHGGELEAGPQPGGGFLVTARLPLEPEEAGVP
jgi:signal transduction histidine kinase